MLGKKTPRFRNILYHATYIINIHHATRNADRLLELPRHHRYAGPVSVQHRPFISVVSRHILPHEHISRKRRTHRPKIP